MNGSAVNRIFAKNNLLVRDKKEEVPKKLIRCYTMRTRGGKNGNEDKTNQDSFLANYNLNGDTKTHLFGVYDGHGKESCP